MHLRAPQATPAQRIGGVTRFRSGPPWRSLDHKTLYIAARTGIYKIRLNVAGIPAGR